MKLSSELFELFKTANAGRYFEKMSFYKIKPKILDIYGQYIGYDVQTIDIICRKCYGTGYLHTGKCPCCANGLYKHNVYYLRRYWLNNEYFHIPQETMPKFGDPLLNKIKGKISHEAVDLAESYKALIILLHVFDRTELERLLKYSLSAQKYFDLYNREINQFIKNLEVSNAA